MKSNLHTHSTYCDGKNSLEEMVQRAIQLNFRSLGFSGHAYSAWKFDLACMTKENTKLYFTEIDRLKEKYKDKITIFKGLELEACHVEPYSDLDFTIGSLHLVDVDGELICVDSTSKILRQGIQQVGGLIPFEKLYYSQLLAFAKKTPFDIVGHLDIYTKFDEKENIFDETNPTYQKIVLASVDELNSMGKIFEINTGGIARGYKTKVYPAPFVIKHLKEINASIIISTDSHKVATLDFYYDETVELLKSYGFKEQMELTDNGFVFLPL